MFGIGFWELCLIGLVALFVVGPQRMPGMIRTVGQWFGYAQRIARDVRRELDLEIDLELGKSGFGSSKPRPRAKPSSESGSAVMSVENHAHPAAAPAALSNMK